MDTFSAENSLMQCTGLTDSEGTLIYEGDILETLPMSGMYYPNRMVVEYHCLAFVYQGITPYASKHTKYTVDTITNKNIKQDNKVKVIGNIYQNPELLNQNAKQDRDWETKARQWYSTTIRLG